MVNTLANQTVVIIGGTSGIGLSVAKHILDSTQANVIVASSSEARVKNAAKLDRVKAYLLDATDKAAVQAFFEKIGSFDHLVFTAGDRGFNFMTIDQFTKEGTEKIFDIRYWALIDCIKHAVKHMPKSRTSSITFTSSTISERPSPGWVLVGAGVTGALNSMSRGLALDLAPIRVNCVAPGVVNTELWSWLEEGPRTALFENYSKKFLTGSVGDPDEIAEAYGYLIRCMYVTGQIVTVDGGAALV